nr:PEP-CTERM sorting domain-containing protein [uncultured Rhodopila sp.]
MNRLLLSVSAALLSLAASAAHADTLFTFTDNFASGDVVTGSFDGTAHGNLITGLSNISVSFDGVAFNGNGSLLAFHMATSTEWQPGGAVASFDGTQNNFLFQDRTATQLYLDVSGQEIGALNNYIPYPETGNDASGPNTWTISAVPAAVPEPGTLALLGIAFAGIGLARRRKAISTTFTAR